ncbi:MAG: ATP-binding protein [Candidatus Thorarchaeota archaeon]
MSLEKRLNVEKIISSISSKFVGKIDLDKAINSSLQDLGNISRADRVSVFLFNANTNCITNTYEWCRKEIKPKLDILQRIDRNTIYWWIRQVEKLNFINIKDVSKLPVEAKLTKKFMESQNIKSFLGFPIYHEIKIKGFVCFSKVLETFQWKGKDFAILRIFSQILESTYERIQAENALRENQEFLSAMFDAIAEGIIAIDNDEQITRLNERFIYMWRVPDEFVEKMDFESLIESISYQLKDPKKFKQKLLDLRHDQKNDFDMIFFKDGRIFEQYSCPITLEGKIAGRLWSFRDVSEHQHAEQELRKSEKRYRKAYERANFYKDIFTHDMNNIFHNIQFSTELISMFKGKPEKLNESKEIFTTIENQIDRGVMLINNVRKLSEVEDRETHLKEINLNHILNEAIDFANKSSQGKQLRIKYNDIDNEFNVLANEFLLDVCENILHNAIKYNQNQIVEIEINHSKMRIDKSKFVRLEFIDNGIGILDEHKELIFQRGNKKEKNARSMGIGLSLVKKIIESYNGKNWVQNRVKNDYQKGSNFIILIPVIA